MAYILRYLYTRYW